jgi:pyrroline-5-carboxylate reductase
MSKTRIAFIGAGNMAASLIGGLRPRAWTPRRSAPAIRAKKPAPASAPNTASKPSPTTHRPSTVPM